MAQTALEGRARDLRADDVAEGDSVVSSLDELTGRAAVHGHRILVLSREELLMVLSGVLFVDKARNH